MGLENPKIHQCPKPWRSGQRRTNIVIAVFSGLFFFSACLFLYVGNEADMLESSVFWVISLANIGVAIALILIGLYLKSDGKDEWVLKLPYNRLLFDIMSEQVPAMFAEKKYRTSENPTIKMRHVIRDMHTFETSGHSYTLDTGTGNDLVLEFGLTVTHTDEHTYYYFEMVLRNIRMQNLETASALAWNIQLLLENAEYRKFKQVLGA